MLANDFVVIVVVLKKTFALYESQTRSGDKVLNDFDYIKFPLRLMS